MKIVADNTVPFLKGIAEPIAEVKYLTSKEFTPENVQDADILIVRSIDKCNPANCSKEARGETDYQRYNRFRPYRHPVL